MNVALDSAKKELALIALTLGFLLSACGQGYIINSPQDAEQPQNSEPEHANETITNSQAPTNHTPQVSIPTVVELGDCPTDFSNNGNNACKRLAVSCGGYDQTEVLVRTQYPSTRIAPAGTIIFGSGGTGTNWVYNPGNPDNSWLWIKLQGAHDAEGKILFTPAASWDPAGDERTGCPQMEDGEVTFGLLMPQSPGAPAQLPQETLDLFEDWILVGAPGPGEL